MTGHNNLVRAFIQNGHALEAHIRSIQRAPSSTATGGILISAREIIEPFLDTMPEHDRVTAKTMSEYYEILYLVENRLRTIVATVLFDEVGDNWWSVCVPQNVREYAEGLIQKEVDLAVTARSTDPLNYVTFGHLADIIRPNADKFKGAFTSIKGVEKVLAVINNLRGPVAHGGVLADDEVARLYLAIRDLFRLIRY